MNEIDNLIYKKIIDSTLRREDIAVYMANHLNMLAEGNFIEAANAIRDMEKHFASMREEEEVPKIILP